MDDRRDEKRRVGDAARNDDVGTTFDGWKYRFRTEIGIGGDEWSIAGKRPVRFHCKRVDRKCGENVVAGHDGDANVYAELASNIDDRTTRAHRVGGTHVVTMRVPVRLTIGSVGRSCGEAVDRSPKRDARRRRSCASAMVRPARHSSASQSSPPRSANVIAASIRSPKSPHRSRF